MPSNGEKISNAAAVFAYMPLMRQIGILIGLAASVAIGVVVALWSQEPPYRLLYQNLSAMDSAAVVDALTQASVPYKIDNNSGAISVAGEAFYKAKMALAGQGLPRGGNQGFESLEKDQGLGTSQFMERARYVHALEGELARTISSFSNVKTARVHIALPRESVFVRDHREPSASVLVDMYGGRTLDDNQVSSIVSLVATSVPNLKSENVTVVDQAGSLLTDRSKADVIGVTNKQFKYVAQVENNYVRKVEDLLTPLFGVGKVKARVSADIDFTQLEQTKESFNPDLPSLRSEQVMKEIKSDSSASGGIPGALSNDAPDEKDEIADASPTSNTSDQKESFTKNYELDKTITHSKQQEGRIKRLSVAVLIDNYVSTDPDTGEVVRTQISGEELERVKKLVNDAIGYNPKRGDTVTIINSDFKIPKAIEALPEEPFYQNPWFWEIAKQVLGALFILFILFGVLKPMLTNLSSKSVQLNQVLGEQYGKGGGKGSGGNRGASAGEGADVDADSMLGGALLSYEDQMRAIKKLASEDPKRVAQVVKKWMDTDA